MKDKMHFIISRHIKTSFNKIQDPFIIKINELGIQGMNNIGQTP